LPCDESFGAGAFLPGLCVDDAERSGGLVGACAELGGARVGDRSERDPTREHDARDETSYESDVPHRLLRSLHFRLKGARVTTGRRCDKKILDDSQTIAANPAGSDGAWW
jgi:hypothetical protein